MEIKPCAWACTDFDGRVGIGLTKIDAKKQAGGSCEEFFALIAAPALKTFLLALASELDSELDSGARWTKPQHTCASVSVALRALAASIAGCDGD